MGQLLGRSLRGQRVVDLAIRRPSLDDVFLSLTGHTAEQKSDDDDTNPEGTTK